jgi:hypothetical protein
MGVANDIFTTRRRSTGAGGLAPGRFELCGANTVSNVGITVMRVIRCFARASLLGLLGALSNCSALIGPDLADLQPYPHESGPHADGVDAGESERGRGTEASDEMPSPAPDGGNDKDVSPDGTLDDGPDASPHGGRDADADLADGPDASPDVGGDADADLADGPTEGDSCSCPYSACQPNHACAPVCSTLLATLASQTVIMNRIADLNSPRGEGVGGVTGDGRILFLTSSANSCTFEKLQLAVPTGQGGYNVYDLSSESAWTTTRGAFTISFDGTKVVLSPVSQTAFLIANLDGAHIDQPTQGPFTAINYAVPSGATLKAPVLSADDLTFYYRVESSDSLVKGNYASVRSSVNDDFPVGTRLPQAIQDYWWIMAVSSDDLTLFLEKDYTLYLFTRPDKSHPFTNPNGTAPPPSLRIAQARPLADCSFIGTCGAGCANQDLCFVPAQ